MIFKRSIHLILLVSCWIVSSSFLEAPILNVAKKDGTYSVRIQITGIRNTEGRIQFQIYLDQESFKKEEPWKQKFLSKKDIKNHTLIYELSGFTPGKYYGFALLDDENSDGKMNFSFFIPKEGYGFSDYFHTSWSKRPTFHDFKFSSNSDKTVSMKIRYMQ